MISILPLSILSVDGVVPAKPVGPADANIPIEEIKENYLLLMPASRVEIYVRNDGLSEKERTYVLRTKALNAGADQWPEIQLARIVLKPTTVASPPIAVALNVPVARPLAALLSQKTASDVILPTGCVRDLDPTQKEYRRVTFGGSPGTPTIPAKWHVTTEIVRRPVTGPAPFPEKDFKPGDPSTTIEKKPFEDYLQSDGLVDWNKPHVCIVVDHKGSHKQLWVLSNATVSLHNFHIHQMKFRLATKKELLEDYQIALPSPVPSCPSGMECPSYKLFDDREPTDLDTDKQSKWHDTIPIPAFNKVFIIMSFDAPEQIGRYVFHCHILKHEDRGLMAPIEILDVEALPLKPKPSPQ